MLSIARKRSTIVLPSGVKATVQELVGKHQRTLTEQRTKKESKINQLLSDVLVSVAGVDYEGMSEAERFEFVRKMLAADRKYILAEARQLAMSYDPTYQHRYEWKDADGVKQEVIFEISLIGEENRGAIIEKVAQIMSAGGEDEGEIDAQLLQELNRVGCFPTKPYKDRFDSYCDVLRNMNKEFKLVEHFGDTVFTFTLIDGIIEEGININDLSSHTRILCRRPRYRETVDGGWKKITKEILDSLPIRAIDALRNAMDEFEGAVDTVEQIDNPDETKGGKLTIDIIGEISFFFPSGKV